MSEGFVINLGKNDCFFYLPTPPIFCGAVSSAVRIDARDPEFKTGKIIYNFSHRTSLKIPKLSAINTGKSIKLIAKESVIKFRNLSLCPRNTS